MKTLEHWTNLIQDELRGDQTATEQAMIIRSYVREIQADAIKGDGPTVPELLLEYHTQQKEWWRKNTNDPHNIGTALYAMHCELVNIYDAIASGDARRNYEHNHPNP